MADETKPCPFCGEAILAVAKKCRHCRSYLDETLAHANGPSAIERLATPVGRPASAIIAGYAGLFAIVPMFGLPFAVTALWCGISALRQIKATSGLAGRGRAWFGIVIGGLMTVISLMGLVLIIIGVMSETANR